MNGPNLSDYVQPQMHKQLVAAGKDRPEYIN